jgi:hypothetical protein
MISFHHNNFQLIYNVLYMKSLIYFHQNYFEVICNVTHMKFVICFHHNSFELIYNVIYVKFVICFQHISFIKKKNSYFLLVSATKFYSQVTFVTKISLVALDKSHAILITNNKGIGWKTNSTNTNSSSNSIIYVLSHAIKMQLFWSLLKVNDVRQRVPIFDYLKLLLLLLFWNNIVRSIHMFGWFILWHMAQCKYDTWHLKMNLIQNTNIKLVGT